MSNFKKWSLITAAALTLAACGGNSADEETDVETGTEETTQTEENAETEEFHFEIAAQTNPMTDVVELAIGQLEENPAYTGELIEVTDNIQYNEAVLNDEAFASFAQHEPYMELFNEERDGDLVAIQPIYNAIVGYYSPVYDSIDDIENGAEVAIASDPANLARSLFVLEQYDLIELDENAGMLPTLDDITDNPYELEFTELEVGNTPAAYEDGVELVFSYPTYIDAKLGLKTSDALFLEDDPDNMFALQVVVREENVDTPEAEALVEAFTSQEVADFLDELAGSGHLERSF